MREKFAELPDWQKVLVIMGATVAGGLFLTIVALLVTRESAAPSRAVEYRAPAAQPISAVPTREEADDRPEYSREFTAAERETAIGMTIGEFLEAEPEVRMRTMRYWAQQLHPEDSDDARGLRELVYISNLMDCTKKPSLHKFSVEDGCRAVDGVVSTELARRFRYPDSP
jgi:hypothetical protein